MLELQAFGHFLYVIATYVFLTDSCQSSLGDFSLWKFLNLTFTQGDRSGNKAEHSIRRFLDINMDVGSGISLKMPMREKWKGKH